MEARKTKILYAEDDINLAFVTRDNLEVREYEVKHCENGQDALATFQGDKFDICVLDVMMPKMDGFELAKEIRKINREIPILFLTAKADKDDRIAGLRLGADDYIVKPFSIEELILKIEVFIKRSRLVDGPSQAGKRVQLGKYTLDLEALELRLGPDVKKLTYREGELLNHFAAQRGKILKREDILNTIWGDDDYFKGRSLDVFISRLRKYLKDDPEVKIENIHGIGFRLDAKS